MSISRYPQYKYTGHDWPPEIPRDWDLGRLKDKVRLVTKKSESANNPVALENVEGWTGRLVETETVFEGDGIGFCRGDILFGKLRPYLAKAYLADIPGEAVGDFFVMRPDVTVCGRFLQYQMLTREFIAIIESSTFGAKMPRASWNFLGPIPLACPSLPEQQAIAAFLDRETAAIDNLVAEQRRLILLLEEKRQSVICHAVTKGLSPDTRMKESGIEWLSRIPEHWQTVRLGVVFQETAESGNDDLPVLSVSIHHGVSDKEFDGDELERKVIRSEDRSKYIRVEPGDLVYNMMRAWQGAFGTVKVEGMVSPAYVVARPRFEILTEFVEYLLRTPQAIEELRRHSHGVTDFRLRLYWDEFKAIKIALPLLEEQQAILEFISDETQKIDALVAESEIAVALLQERRSALISAAVTGKIDIRGIEGMNATPKRVATA